MLSPPNTWARWGLNNNLARLFWVKAINFFKESCVKRIKTAPELKALEYATKSRPVWDESRDLVWKHQYLGIGRVRIAIARGIRALFLPPPYYANHFRSSVR